MTVPPEATADADLQPFLQSSFTLDEPQFSPDGRRVAYQSNELGRSEIFVVDYPGPGGKWQVSVNGGALPRWSRDGRELFFANGSSLMPVDVDAGPAFQAGTPRALVERPHQIFEYDVAPDGRFLMLRPAADGQARELHVVINWIDELRRRVPLE
jgi:dipeptidyl aminopeptidase/acylaminoacyl peptidase